MTIILVDHVFQKRSINYVLVLCLSESFFFEQFLILIMDSNKSFAHHVKSLEQRLNEVIP